MSSDRHERALELLRRAARMWHSDIDCDTGDPSFIVWRGEVRRFIGYGDLAPEPAPPGRHRVVNGMTINDCPGLKAQEGQVIEGLVADHVGEDGKIIRLEWSMPVWGRDVSIPVTFCPWCGERLPATAEFPEATP